jgi:DNA topoisomerase-1
MDPRRMSEVVTLARHAVTPDQIGLQSVDLDRPGHGRRRHGKGFSYHSATGRSLSQKEKARCLALAIPPAWKDVWISPAADTHILAYGTDAKGRRQYVYHPDWRAHCEIAKFRDLPLFAEGLVRLRRRVHKILKHPQSDDELAVAAIIRLMDAGGLRVGSLRFRQSSGTVGATTLKKSHIDQDGDTLRLHFRGKSGKEHRLTIKDDELAEAVDHLRHLPGPDLFDVEHGHITAREVNAFIGDTYGLPFTAKDFRTWGGSVAAATRLRKADGLSVKAVAEAASAWLGNTPAIAQSSYIHPVLLDHARDRRALEEEGGPQRLRKNERICYAAMMGWEPGA